MCDDVEGCSSCPFLFVGSLGKEVRRMRFYFTLEWEELPEELREAKVDEYLRCLWEEGAPEVADKPLEDVLADQELRDQAERSIEARFPVRF